MVCGLAIGVPREHPDVKPKQPEKLLIHKDHYRSDDIKPEMLEYDKEVSEYNKVRAGEGGTSDNDWGIHIMNYYRTALQYNMKDYVVSQGFDMIK